MDPEGGEAEARHDQRAGRNERPHARQDVNGVVTSPASDGTGHRDPLQHHDRRVAAEPELKSPAVDREEGSAPAARPAASAQGRHPPRASGATTARPTMTARSIRMIVSTIFTMRMITRIVNVRQLGKVHHMDTLAEELTIDELAQLVGLPSSTLRLYRTRGLLPPPTRRGRAALHGPATSLAWTSSDDCRSEDSRWPPSRTWSSSGGRSKPRSDPRSRAAHPGRATPSAELRLAPAELAERFPDIDLTPELMTQVISMGLIEIDEEGMVVIGSPVFLEVGSALVELGFPLSEVLDEAATLQSEMNEVAERFASMFDRHIWRPFTAAGKPDDDLPRVAHVLEQLGPLADRSSTLRCSKLHSHRRSLPRRRSQARDLDERPAGPLGAAGSRAWSGPQRRGGRCPQRIRCRAESP